MIAGFQHQQARAGESSRPLGKHLGATPGLNEKKIATVDRTTPGRKMQRDREKTENVCRDNSKAMGSTKLKFRQQRSETRAARRLHVP